MADNPEPRDRREAVAQFRASVVGHLKHQVFDRGELIAELRRLSQKLFLPPGGDVTRRYSVSTLERWLREYRNHSLRGLMPQPRSDRGHAQFLSEEQRQLLLAIREEYPSASSRLIIETLEGLGRLTKAALKPGTLNRLYAESGQRRGRRGSETQQRLRWRAPHPHALWHADVCHGPTLSYDGKKVPVRIHGIMDDYSRQFVALDVRSKEREIDMLQIFLRSLIMHGKPGALFLDNGATYRGHGLRTVCERLGITLIHARPHQPEGRGKMERVWRTLREQCLDYIPQTASLEDVRRALVSFRLTYQKAPHAGLMGDTPERVVAEAEATPVSETELRAAFTVEQTRLVKNDSTLSIRGCTYQVTERFLSGKRVRVQMNLLDHTPADHVTYRNQAYRLEPVDPIYNGMVRRVRSVAGEPGNTGFDPNKVRTAKVTKAIRKGLDKR